MTKQKSTKRALLLSALSLLMCVSMLIGSTFAWFTDSVTSGNNIIKSGNLDVEMYWADGTKAVPTADADWTDASTGAIFDYDKWEPGYTEVRHIKIANVGTLALKYQLSIAANGEVTELADVIDVFYVDPATQVNGRNDLTEDMRLGTLSEVLKEISTTASGNLEAGEAHTVTLALKMQESAGNEYQNKSIGSSFEVKLSAIQLNFENDSFGPDYDEGLDPTVKYISTFDELKNAARNGGKVALNGDLNITDPAQFFYGNYVTAVYNDLILDLNGHSITLDYPKDNVADAPILFYVYSEGASLTIVGDGDVIAKNDAFLVFPRGVSEGVYIYGGNYYNIDETSGTKNDINAIVYSQTNSNIHIYGGTFNFKNVNGHCGGFNVYDNSGAEIILYEGVLLSNSNYYKGSDADEIHLAKGCYLKNVQIDGKEWWQVTKMEEDITYTSDYNEILSGRGESKNYVLNGNLTADNFIYLGDTTNSIDLNGKNVDATGGFLFVTDGKNSSLTIDGNGTVNTDAGYAGYADNGGSLNINGGTYQLGETNNKAHLYSQNSATIVINDGTFISTDANTPIVYCINGFVEINGGFFQNTANPSAALLNMGNNLNYVNNQKITLRGGTFVNWNPIKDSSFAYDWPQCPALIVLADGYKMVSETQANGDIWYTVVAE